MKARLRAALGRAARRLLRQQPLARTLAVSAMSTPAALARIAARGLEVGTIVDVGASDGRWSLEALRLFPGVRCHLIEANRAHATALQRLCAARPGISHSLVAAGPADGEVAFDDRNPFGGQARPATGQDHGIVPQRSLASLARELRLPPPYMIKLDTHGYEAPILDGAVALLPRTSLLVIEAYTFQLQPGSLRFHELCAYLDRHGFAVIDLSEPLWRPRDGALWQFDLFFVPRHRPEFAHARFA